MSNHYFIVVLVCNSLTTYDVEHLLIGLFAVCMSSVVRGLFRSFAHFKMKLSVFSLLSCKHSLYILDANVFSQAAACSFVPLTLYVDPQFPLV